MNKSDSQVMLFHRDFHAFTGGHLKVWHYFNHVRASHTFTPKIYFTARSRWDETNPWRQCDEIVPKWSPADADVLFIGGMDWNALPIEYSDNPAVPIINIVQGLRHADATDPRYEFLNRRAIRICVNWKIEEALRDIPAVNGPVFHVPMGLDQTKLPLPGIPEYDILIAALKAPKLGRELHAKLQRPGRRIGLLTKPLPRSEYLRKVADSSIALFLPLPFEGFYLPALEAMAMRRTVVCPDITSCRVYCTPGRNSFCPDYTIDAIAEATEDALALSDGAASDMGNHAAKTAARYTLERERDAFCSILRNIDELWER